MSVNNILVNIQVVRVQSMGSQKSSGLFDADQIGHWGSMPMCRHRDKDDHIVLSLKLMSVPFKGKIVAGVVKPILTAVGVFNSEDSYEHRCIFVDTKCKVCRRQTVYTLEFQKNGPSKRRGYYKMGAREQCRITCRQSWEVQWADVCQIYNENANRAGRYSIHDNNCQDFTRRLWPQLKAYVDNQK